LVDFARLLGFQSIAANIRSESLRLKGPTLNFHNTAVGLHGILIIELVSGNTEYRSKVFLLIADRLGEDAGAVCGVWQYVRQPESFNRILGDR
jgi:hypothetical protein